jgi:hypothetical protein
MRYALTVVLLLVLVVGCSGEKKKEPIPLDQVPEKIMKVAKEKFPDVTFERAMREPNGDYEVIGKNKQGKVREIDISPAGEVTQIE